jgi:hypothetical protein
MYTKHIDSIHPTHLLHSFLLPSPFPLVPTLRQDLFNLPVLHFYNCILIVQGGFTMVFHTCIYWTLIRWTPSITYSFSITLPLFNSLQCISLC